MREKLNEYMKQMFRRKRKKCAGAPCRAREAYFPAAYISIQSCVLVVIIIVVIFILCFCKGFIVHKSTDPFLIVEICWIWSQSSALSPYL
jgi:hypothetical protein